MNEEKVIIYGLDEIDAVAEYLLSLRKQCQVFTFAAPLGAGKTTLVQKMLRRSGVEQDVITSPTFTYVNIYSNDKKDTFYHFDCYRVNSVDMFLEAGFGEYLYQPKSWAFIEWPDVIKPLLNQNVCCITIDYYPEEKRKLTLQVVE